MLITVNRFHHGAAATLGLLTIDHIFQCFTLEDAYHAEKIPGETRIPDGMYPIRVRTFGRMHGEYEKKFAFHKGMLEIVGIDNYTDVLFHIGNRNSDTRGCVLVGMGAEVMPDGGMITHSGNAYGLFYQKVIGAAQAGDLAVLVRSMDLAAGV